MFQTKTGSVQSSGDWKLDPEELKSKFSSKTKAIIVNNPNNPLGKVHVLDRLEINFLVIYVQFNINGIKNISLMYMM